MKITDSSWISIITYSYPAFVCIDFRGEGHELGPPAEFGTYAGNRVYLNNRTLQQTYGEQGAMFSFAVRDVADTTIVARVGVSLISSGQACSNAEDEIPDFDFERVRQEAKDEWNELLGRFQVQIGNRDTAVLFYSSVGG